MQTGGHGNDAVMILVPVGVSIVVGVILFGGPAEAAGALNTLVWDIADFVMTVVNALF